MMSTSFELSGETGILAVSDELTIEYAAELKTAITDALAASAHLVIDMTRATTIDLCCLQLLCSAHRAAVKEGKTFSILSGGEGFVESIREAGYLRHVGCMTNSGHDCLWTEKTAEKTDSGVWG
jgi:anti-anti-sigma regulatory factor